MDPKHPRLTAATPVEKATASVSRHGPRAEQIANIYFMRKKTGGIKITSTGAAPHNMDYPPTRWP